MTIIQKGEPMSDLISRQAAIDAVHEEFDDCLVWDESGQRTADEFEIIINRLPSAQRKGKWKYEKMKHILNGEVRTVRICSECNGGWFRYDLSDGVEDVEPNYCPNCGALMKVEEDE